MTHPIKGIHHVAIAVTDVPSATHFYVQAAQLSPWPAAQGLILPELGNMWRLANAGIRFLSADPSGQQQKRRAVSEAGITHMCLQTTDPAVIHHAYAKAGGSFHSGLIDLGTGFLYCYARDLEKNVTEIEGVAPVWADSKPWLAHVNLATSDFQRLLGFYAALLGTTAIRSPRLKDDPRLDAIADLSNVELRMGWVPAGNMQIEVIQYYNPPTIAHTGQRDPGATGYRYIALEVAHLTKAVEHLVGCGGSLACTDPAGLHAMCRDPDGNELLLLQPDAQSQPHASIADLDDPNITQRFATAREAYLNTP
jgi:catechol 2,3-dioxygenase-like lactoylglutathione lyase family enzyme